MGGGRLTQQTYLMAPPLQLMLLRRLSARLVMEQVQCRATLEPFDLGCAIGVIQQQPLRGAIRVLHDARDGFPWGQVSESDEADAVVLPDVVVVHRITECKRQQALFLQVALMDARKASDDDRRPAQ